jgi:hypothetical protein
MAACISSHAHTDWKCWNIGRSGIPRVHGLEIVPGIFDCSDAVACELPSGGATFHGGRMLHYTPGNYTADYRRALIVMGGLPPVKRPTLRRFPWLERQNTARARRATTAS